MKSIRYYYLMIRLEVYWFILGRCRKYLMLLDKCGVPLSSPRIVQIAKCASHYAATIYSLERVFQQLYGI